MLDQLPPRERQIVDLLYALGEVSAADIRHALPVLISDQAVRAMLSRLEAKGFVTRRRSEAGYLFSAAIPESKAKQSAVRQLVSVFFRGSHLEAASALIGMSDDLREDELSELERMLAEAKKRKRK